MAEELKTLEEGYESLAAALNVKQEWQRKILDVVPLAEGELLDAVVDRIRLLLWLHAEAVWQRDQLDAEALKWTEIAGEHAAELESERKVVEQWEQGHQNEVLPYTAKLEAEVDTLRARIEQLVWERDEAREQWSEAARLVELRDAEIARLRREVEFEALGADTFSGADRFYSEAREESEECSGRDDTGQASREEAAEQTVGTGYPQGSGPGHGSATPAPPSSRPQCAVHPEGGTA